jgi:phage gp45-like
MVLINKLRNLLRFSVSTTDQQDKSTNGKAFYNTQIKSYDGLNETQVYYPYGFYAVAPQGSQFITLNIAGQAENKVSLPFDFTTQFTGLKAGEALMGNQRLKSFVSFLNDGSVNIETPKGDLNVKIIQGDANVTVSGNTNIETSGTLDVKASGNATLESGAQVQIKVGGATLTLTAASLVSSVPITAPSISVSGGLTVGTDATIGGKSFNAHTHTPGSYQAGGDAVTGDSGTMT